MVGTLGSSSTGVDAALRRVVRGEEEGRTLLLLLLRVEGERRALLLRMVGEGRTARAVAAGVEVASGRQRREGVSVIPPALARPAMLDVVSPAGGPIGTSTGVVAQVAAVAAAAAGCFAWGRPAFFLGGMAG